MQITGSIRMIEPAGKPVHKKGGCMTQQLITYNNPAFIHSSALLYGKIIINEGASIWPHVVIRSEAYEVEIGEKSNIQDFVMIHVGYHCGTIIGRFSTIAHHCTLHGCTIGDYSLDL